MFFAALWLLSIFLFFVSSAIMPQIDMILTICRYTSVFTVFMLVTVSLPFIVAQWFEFGRKALRLLIASLVMTPIVWVLLFCFNIISLSIDYVAHVIRDSSYMVIYIFCIFLLVFFAISGLLHLVAKKALGDSRVPSRWLLHVAYMFANISFFIVIFQAILFVVVNALVGCPTGMIDW